MAEKLCSLKKYGGGGIDISDVKIVSRTGNLANTYYAIDVGIQASDMHWVIAVVNGEGYERGIVNNGTYTVVDYAYRNDTTLHYVFIQKVQGTSVYVMQNASASLSITVIVG